MKEPEARKSPTVVNRDVVGPTNKLNRFMTAQLEKNKKGNKSEQKIEVDIDYEDMALEQ